MTLELRPSADSVSGVTELVARLNPAVTASSPDAITECVKRVLEDVLGQRTLQLPPRFKATRSGSYARRLVHEDRQRRYTVVAMAWAPGQATPLHDHGGLWCVEGVVEGEVTVTNYHVWSVEDGFSADPLSGPTTAIVGTAGRLIPPTDYHVLANLSDQPAVTLHVYGGEIHRCRVFMPSPGGRYEEVQRTLRYHD